VRSPGFAGFRTYGAGPSCARIDARFDARSERLLGEPRPLRRVWRVVGVDLSRLRVAMSHPLLDESQWRSGGSHPRAERVPEVMEADVVAQTGALRRPKEGLLRPSAGVMEAGRGRRSLARLFPTATLKRGRLDLTAGKLGNEQLDELGRSWTNLAPSRVSVGVGAVATACLRLLGCTCRPMPEPGRGERSGPPWSTAPRHLYDRRVVCGPRLSPAGKSDSGVLSDADRSDGRPVPRRNEIVLLTAVIVTRS
jgi:hypothetical protein